MNQGDCGAFGWGNRPTAAQKVYLLIGIDPAAQMERQVQVQQGGGRARPYGRALVLQGLVPSRIGAQADGAADGGILVGDLAIQYELSGGVIADVFISQERYQALLEGSETPFDLAFGLGAGGDPMGHAQGGEGALELRTGVPVVGHGIMAKEAQAIGVDDQGQGVVEKEPAKVLKMIPGRIGGDKDCAQEFSRVIIDGQEQERSLFQMIKNTYAQAPANILSAYKDNAAVINGHPAPRFYPSPASREYGFNKEDVHILMKVETHNHPTAISPFPGASTGSGGEIRDEGATGRGGKPKAGLTGFTVSNLKIPGFVQPWERDYGKPGRIVSALDIMIEGPLGGAAFNNEFGRPNLCGYFRSYEQEVDMINERRVTLRVPGVGDHRYGVFPVGNGPEQVPRRPGRELNHRGLAPGAPPRPLAGVCGRQQERRG